MSDHTEAEGAEHAAGGEKPKGKKKKLIFIGLGVVALIAGAGVPMFFMMGSDEHAQEEAAVEQPLEEARRLENLDLGIFIVNLSETASFLKTHIVLEYDAALLEREAAAMMGAEGGAAHGGGGAGGGEGGEGEGGTPHLLQKKETAIRHVIIRILSSKQVDEVLTTDGKDLLGEVLVDGINDALGIEQPVVSQVYFTEFIIQ